MKQLFLRPLSFALLILLSLVSSSTRLHAQVDRGAIKGETVDVQKANLPGCNSR